jgi:acyl carrier protein
MISERLKKVILEQLELEDFAIDDRTTAAMVPGWDSLSHARIVAAVEDEYGIRFDLREIVRLENVGQLQALVDRKTA